MFQASTVLTGDFLAEKLSDLMQAISRNYAVDETDYLRQLLPLATPNKTELDAITALARLQVEQVRADSNALHSIDKLLQEYSLDNEEGVILMCLAEALMRIPDSHTADALIRDKLAGANWQGHLQQSDSVLVNASTWGLMLTGKVINLEQGIDGNPNSLLKRLVSRCGEPVIRKAMVQAMKIMAKQFVLGRTINEAIVNGADCRNKGYSYSYDMLGEAAFTQADADNYFNAYLEAIQQIGAVDRPPPSASLKPTISIKLSALHPRYEEAQRQRVLSELGQRVKRLIDIARPLDVGITIDAEEADRLELSLALFQQLYNDPVCRGWGNFGLVVQAYSKRALPVLCWLLKLAAEQQDRIPLRLVKGAYWDSEIKHAQQAGLAGYPVFTRKEGTDCSYLACARLLLSPLADGLIYPQFATHNAHTVASILTMASTDSHTQPYEFQRLHGMGDALYDKLLPESKKHDNPMHDNQKHDPITNTRPRCRIYAPVGAHKDLLPYLVRRLLENGANSSFVHRLVDARTPIAELVQHPAMRLDPSAPLANPRIALPPQILGGDRINSAGINLNIGYQQKMLLAEIKAFDQHHWSAAPIIDGQRREVGEPRSVVSPFDTRRRVGTLYRADPALTAQALTCASAAFDGWNATAVEQRAACLERLADLLQQHRPELMALCSLEAGKSLQDGIDEVREAVDFCRYYAQQGRHHFGRIQTLPGPTGELNELYLQGRGLFVCISPWNFPLAIFIGQISAALVAGNCVIAKPAEQTGLIAHRATELMLEAGIPAGAIQLLTGPGAEIGRQLTDDPRTNGVAFTGSTATAHRINRSLAQRDGAIATLIAETGGQNAMLVDSSALPEQVVADVVQSAFTSAGQRCSALRVLYVQDDIAPRIIELIRGAMAQLTLGDPANYTTDVGPVIDAQAMQQLTRHIDHLKAAGQLVAEVAIPANCHNGHFVSPTAFEIGSMDELTEEHFGPVLHIIRYHANQLDAVIGQINDSGFGLTLGIHSRNQATARYIDQRVKVGNVYINRNQIGAMVGVQPFGGQGLSGTGPKAGGPHYLLRFATERTRSTNTTAVGGNASLLSLGE